MTNPVIPLYAGTLPEGQRITHIQTGHHGTVEAHNCGTYYIRWDAALPARWFDGRLITPATEV